MHKSDTKQELRVCEYFQGKGIYVHACESLIQKINTKKGYSITVAVHTEFWTTKMLAKEEGCNQIIL